MRAFSAERYENDDGSGWTPYTAQDWKKWYDSATIDVVEDIESLAIWNRLLDRMSNARGRYVNWYENLLATSLGIPPIFDTLTSTDDRIEAYRIYMGMNREDIFVKHLVHLLWVGTDEEIEKAIAILKSTTGQDYETARNWTKWWRETH